jgi:TRAP-type C4-dicarboxylate transport system permease small subunit
MNKSKFVSYIIRVLLIIASIAILVMTGIVVANVIGRIFFHSPIMGTVEIAGLMGVIIAAIAVGYSQRENANVIVEIVANKFPPRMRAIVDVITFFLGLLALAVLTWAVLTDATSAFRDRELTGTLKLVEYPFKYIWGTGLLILCLFLCQFVIESIKRCFRK